MENRLTIFLKKIIKIYNNFRYVLTYIIHERGLIMENKITYRIQYEKAIEILVWLANRIPNIDIYHIAKTIYYAEKEHLNKYAKPIIGDTYIRMSYGQVPSGIRDLITQNSWLDPYYLDYLTQSFIVNKDPYENLTALRDPKLQYFSKTDIECLEWSLKKYGKMPFDELKEESHKEKTWLETKPDQTIDYRLMVDDNNPNKDEIIGEIIATAQYASF